MNDFPNMLMNIGLEMGDTLDVHISAFDGFT
jgi:hypothetical protein